MLKRTLVLSTVGLAIAVAVVDPDPVLGNVTATCDRVDLVGFVPGRTVSGTLTVNGTPQRVTFRGPTASYPTPAGATTVTASFDDGVSPPWMAPPRSCLVTPAPTPSPPETTPPPTVPPAVTPPTSTPRPPAKPKPPRPRPRPRVTCRDIPPRAGIGWFDGSRIGFRCPLPPRLRVPRVILPPVTG